MIRTVLPEILDTLPPGHPDAVASRRDLRRLNWIMGNHRWLAAQLAARHRGGRVVELGAGDGSLGRMLFHRQPGLVDRWTGLDLIAPPPEWPAGWMQTDLFSPEGSAVVAAAETVVANLFLHHFENGALARLGTQLKHSRLLLFCEPARRRRHQWQGRLLAPFLNRVTRHDLKVSVAAGFLGGELPEALGLRPVEWRWTVRTGFRGSLRFAAERIE
jgi:hypothetical protein